MQHLLFLITLYCSINALPITNGNNGRPMYEQLEQDTFQKRSPTFGMFSGMMGGGGGGGMPGLGGMMAGLPGMGGMMGGLGGGAAGAGAGAGAGADEAGSSSNTAAASPSSDDRRAAFMAIIAKYMKGMKSGAPAAAAAAASTTTSPPPADPASGLSLPPGTKPADKSDKPSAVPKPDPAGEAMRKRQVVPATAPFLAPTVVGTPAFAAVGTPAQVGAGNLVFSVGTGLNMLLPGPLGAGLMGLLGDVGQEIASGLPPPGQRSTTSVVPARTRAPARTRKP